MCRVQNPPTNVVLVTVWRLCRQTVTKIAFVFAYKERRHCSKHETGWLDNAASGLTYEEYSPTPSTHLAELMMTPFDEASMSRANRTHLAPHHPTHWIAWFTSIPVCILLILWMAGSARAQPTFAPLPLETPTPTQTNPTTLPNIDLVLLIDNSGSMRTSDPKELRISATKFLLDYLQINTKTLHANYQVSIANFGSRVGTTFPLQLLQDNTLQQGLHTEPLTGTEFVAPLQYAVNELRQSNSQTKRVVVIITDGQPGPEKKVLSGNELENYFNNTLSPVVQGLHDANTELFVLAIGDAQQDRDRWLKLINSNNYIPIDRIDDLNKRLHTLFSGLMGQSASLSGILPVNLPLTPQVEPLLEHLTFSFVKSVSALKLTVTDPAGSVITPTIQSADGTYAIYSIADPRGGDWRIQQQGDGSIEYWIDRRYPAVEVTPQAPYPYSGQPISITARLLRNGVVVTQNLRLEALVEATGLNTATPLSSANADGSYTGVFTNTQASGTYSVAIRAYYNGQLISTRGQATTIALLPAPPPPTAPPASPTAIQATQTVTVVVPTAVSTPLPGFVTVPEAGVWWSPILGFFGLLLAGVVIYQLVRVGKKAIGLEKAQEQERSGFTARSGMLEWQKSELTTKLGLLEAELQTERDKQKDLMKQYEEFKKKVWSPEKAANVLNKVREDKDNFRETAEKLNELDHSLGEGASGIYEFAKEIATERAVMAKELLDQLPPVVFSDDNPFILYIPAFLDLVSRESTDNESRSFAVPSILRRILSNSTLDLQKTLEAIVSHNPRSWPHVRSTAISAFHELSKKWQTLVAFDENNSDGQAQSLKELAQWHREVGITYDDNPDLSIWKQTENLAVEGEKRGTTSDCPDAQFYEYLAKLSRFPLHPIECPILTSEFWRSIQLESTVDRDLRQQFFQAFQLKSPLEKSKMIEQLDNFVFVIETLHPLHQKNLKVICARWRKRLDELLNTEITVQDDKMRLSLAPALTSRRKISENIIPFLIENLSSQPIWNIRLRIKCNPQSIRILDQNGEHGNKEIYEIIPSPSSVRNADKEEKEGPILYPGEYIVFDVQQKILRPDTIVPELVYDSYGGKRVSKLDMEECRLVMRTPPARRSPEEKILPNPYKSPYKSASTPFFSDIPSRVQKLEDFHKLVDLAIEGGQGICINLYGHPRVGKTTFLHQIEAELKEEHFLPIYIARNGFAKKEELEMKGILRWIAKYIKVKLEDEYKQKNEEMIWDDQYESPQGEFERIINVSYQRYVGAQKTLVLLTHLTQRIYTD